MSPQADTARGPPSEARRTGEERDMSFSPPPPPPHPPFLPQIHLGRRKEGGGNEYPFLNQKSPQRNEFSPLLLQRKGSNNNILPTTCSAEPIEQEEI